MSEAAARGRRSAAARILREPLLHFAFAGAALFAAYSALAAGGGEPVAAAERTVRIGEREVRWLAETWTRQRQRPPSEAELRGLVADWLREELLAREARALALDRDDTVVRRRLAQKMEFVAEGTARLAEPTETELRAAYDALPAAAEAEARTSFVQVFVDRDLRGQGAEQDARALLAALRGRPAADVATLGDRTLLPPELAGVDEREVAAQFGPDFARAVGALPAGEWQGPIPSGYGLHLVLVTAREASPRRPFEAERDALAAEWRRAREAEAREAYLASLLGKYEVEVAESVRPLLGPGFAVAAAGPG